MYVTVAPAANVWSLVHVRKSVDPSRLTEVDDDGVPVTTTLLLGAGVTPVIRNSSAREPAKAPANKDKTIAVDGRTIRVISLSCLGTLM